jgi:hypothetical protein
MIFQITDIAYDLNDDPDIMASDLPPTLTVDIPDHVAEVCSISELLSEYISVTGFGHNGFNFSQVG